MSNHDSDAVALLDDLLARGFVVYGDPNGGLHVQPRDQLTEADADAIRQHKAALLDLLRREPEPAAFVLTLRPLASATPVVVRLWRALKSLLRTWGFRGTSVGPAPGTAAATPTAAREATGGPREGVAPSGPAAAGPTCDASPPAASGPWTASR